VYHASIGLTGLEALVELLELLEDELAACFYYYDINYHNQYYSISNAPPPRIPIGAPAGIPSIPKN